LAIQDERVADREVVVAVVVTLNLCLHEDRAMTISNL
jgi:hypothetical protein